MLINEILNVPEQLGLWKLINDTVLTVLTQQAQQTASPQSTTQPTAKTTTKTSAVKPPIKRPMARPVQAQVTTGQIQGKK